MIKCSAPGKVILFGEHAVVYGEPALALAVNKRTTCKVSKSSKQTTVNGHKIDEKYHGYILKGIKRTGIDYPLEILTESDIPSGAGMGSSAAITVSTLGCLYELKEGVDEKEIAEDAFEVEYEVQGGASPIDTSTSTHGSAVILSNDKRPNFLWKIKKKDTFWNIHHLSIPDMNIVVGDTGIHAPTGPLVDKVRRFYINSNFAKEIINDIGELVLEGAEALEENNLKKVGKIMNKNHKLLSILGVSHPKLNGLVRAAKRYSFGAKLTGAGGGGSMIALTDRPNKVAEVIEEREGTAYILDSTKKGLTLEESSA